MLNVILFNSILIENEYCYIRAYIICICVLCHNDSGMMTVFGLAMHKYLFFKGTPGCLGV